MTIKEIRKMMRNLNKDGGSVSEAITIEGWGQIKKIGNSYAVGPLPEYDDSDPYTDYSAWCYGWKEKWVLDDIARTLQINQTKQQKPGAAANPRKAKKGKGKQNVIHEKTHGKRN